MATAVTVPLEVYLHTTYRPDRDWVGGELKERNMGEKEHAGLQRFFLIHLTLHDAEWGIESFPELRVQTSAEHFRIPDVCTVRADQAFDSILTEPPLLCIEVLSREDRITDIMERVDDYLAMGVDTVWVVDPWRKKAQIVASDGTTRPVKEWFEVPGTPIRIASSSVWAELDRLQRPR